MSRLVEGWDSWDEYLNDMKGDSTARKRIFETEFLGKPIDATERIYSAASRIGKTTAVSGTDATEAMKRIVAAAGPLAHAFGGLGSAFASAAAATSPAGKLTMEELIKSTKAAELAAAGKGDPSGWKMTSVRWLEERHPEYIRVRTEAAHDTLRRALAAMSYLEAETLDTGGRISRSGAALLREERLDKWDEAQHDEMVRFLIAGGHSARMKEVERGRDVATLEPKPQWPYKPGADEPDILVTSSRAPAVPQTLDDVLDELDNPTAGSW